MRPEAPLSWKKLAFPAFVFLIVPGAVAYASFFFLSDQGDFLEVSIQKKNPNSQTIGLLAASVGPVIGVSSTPLDTATVADSALLAYSGPSDGVAGLSDEGFNHGQVSTYVVRDGDTLSSIAKMFDVSINTILWANNLSRYTKITIGQTLTILPISGVQYTVMKGDTISGIAKKFKGDAEEIRSYNGIIKDSDLMIGSIIIVPYGEVPVAATNYAPASSKVSTVSGPSYEGYYKAPFPSYRKTQGLHAYNGVDLVSTLGVGAPVMSAAGGQVVVAKQGGYNGGYGNYVVLQHANGTQTLYSHLQSVAVAAGAVVYQGQVIGYMGSTGRSTAPHLHFEVRGAKNPF
ncbi:MAG: hypothetical protein A3C13_01585 [Candidatus Lloydbacteria bacterium RIFCSPHIGHO2_02_FULL_50_11]|nr:MAG: hypothetical protein A3C13_01585 [Candidatus Lloydbacteria bacterium RIFCSPHIGHO2_02_FULL_50_11]